MEYQGCENCKHTKKEPTEMPCLECERNRAYDHYEPMTNADRIRNMTDEELATVIMCPLDMHECDVDRCEEIETCIECTLQWLQTEVKEGATDE